MRALPGSVRLVLIIFLASTAIGRTAQETAGDAAELSRLAEVAGHAYADRDLAALERLSADDYSQTDVRGGVLSRAQWLDFVKNRPSEITVDTDDVEVRLYGETAVVTGNWTYRKQNTEKPVVIHSRWTSVWTKYPSGWKRHAFQNTYINPEADRCAVAAAQK